MLNRDFARTSRDIGRVNMIIDQPHIKEQEDWGKVMSKFLTDYKNQQNEEALTAALQSGDQEAIDKAAAAYDPKGFYDAMQKIKASREASDLDFERQKELAGIRADVAERIAKIRKGEGTAAMQNAAYLVNQGYTPEQANAMAFSGQNPAFAQIYPSLGKEGAKKTDQELGKNYASDLDEYNNMVSKMPELESTVKELDKLADDATYMAIGRVYNAAQRELKGKETKGGVALTKYESIINNQILPLLRDTFGAAFTEKDREALQSTLGNPNKHPEERKAALESFIDQKKKSIESKYRKLKSYEQGFGASSYNQTPSDEDAWGGI